MQFIDLWRGHPANDGSGTPCRMPADGPDASGRPVFAGDPAYANQSAIAVGVALRRAGVRISELGRIETCKHHDKSEMHTLNPRQLAEAVRRARLTGLGDIEIITGGDVAHFQNRLIGRTGLLYVRDYWTRNADADGRPTGDLIDLWNGYRTTESWLMEWLSWAGYNASYAAAREMWFWPVR